MEEDVISMQEIFRFRRHGRTAAGGVAGEFETTGVRPSFLDAADGARHRVAGDDCLGRDGSRSDHDRALTPLIYVLAFVAVVLVRPGASPASSFAPATATRG